MNLVSEAERAKTTVSKRAAGARALLLLAGMVIGVLLLGPASWVSAYEPVSRPAASTEMRPDTKQVQLARNPMLLALAKQVPAPVPFLSREDLLRRCRELKAAREGLTAASAHSSKENNGKGGPSQCGNGRCQADKGETCSSCAADCGACSYCGDGKCDPGESETCSDCRKGPDPDPTIGCGDGICAWPTEHVNNCPVDCPCQTPFGGPIC